MARLRSAPDLILRRLCRSDLAAFQAYRNDPEVARYQSWDVMSEEKALGFLSDVQHSPPLRAGHWSQIGIATLSPEQLIGDMGWFLSESEDEVELGITLECRMILKTISKC